MYLVIVFYPPSQKGAEMLMNLMGTDIFNMTDKVSKSVYDAFCGKQESETECMADHFFKYVPVILRDEVKKM